MSTKRKSRKSHREPESKTVPETTGNLTEEQKRAEISARELASAMSGLGTNESEIIRIILGNSNNQLQLIKNQYLLLFKQVSFAFGSYELLCFWNKLSTDFWRL